MTGSNSSGSSLILLILIFIIIGAGFLGSQYYSLSQDHAQLQKEYTTTKKALDVAVKQAQNAVAQFAAARQDVINLKSQVDALSEELQAAKNQIDEQNRFNEQLRAENENLRIQAGYHGVPPQQQTQVVNAGAQSPSIEFAIPATGRPAMSGLVSERLEVIVIAVLLAGMILGFGSFLMIRRKAGRQQKRVTLEMTTEQMRDYISYRRQCSRTGSTQPVRTS